MLPVPGAKPNIPFNSTTCAIPSQFPLQFRKDRSVYLYYFRFSSHFSLQLRISQSFSTVQSKAERPIYLYNYGFFIPFFSAIRPQNTRIFPLLFCHLPFLSTISSHFSLQLMPANPVFSAFCIFLHYSSRFSLQLDRIVSTTSPLFLTEIFPIFSTSSPYCFYN